MLTTKSTLGHQEVVARLVAAVERRGLIVFARIDHAGAARQVDLDLRPLEVVVFGNPRIGTPLMVSDPRIGIELPMRMSVWQDTDGQTLLGHHDPRDLAAGYQVEEHRATLEKMAGLLGELAVEASGA